MDSADDGLIFMSKSTPSFIVRKTVNADFDDKCCYSVSLQVVIL